MRKFAALCPHPRAANVSVSRDPQLQQDATAGENLKHAQLVGTAAATTGDKKKNDVTHQLHIEVAPHVSRCKASNMMVTAEFELKCCESF